MRTLRDINEQILDMSKSTFVDETGKEREWDTSTWKEDLLAINAGKFKMKTKTYYNPNAKPKEWLWWCRYDPPRATEFKTARYSLPAKAVSVDRDPYWPEEFEPDSNGYFVHGDLVLMKRPYVDHLKDEIGRVKRSQGSAKALMEEFNELTRREGVGLTGKAKEDVGSQI